MTTGGQQAEDRNGRIVPCADGGVRLEFRRTWLLDGDHVWGALTEPERVARWIGRYEGDCAPGAEGRLTMTFEEGEQVTERLHIAECVPGQRLVLEWPDQPGRRVEVVLASQRGGTTLLVTQELADEVAAPDVATGVHWYLDRLDAEVSGRPQPADLSVFAAEVGPGYGCSPT